MGHPNKELLQKGYDAFEKGDLDTLRGLFTDDIVFHTGGRNQLSGDYKGQDEVFGFFGKLAELTGGTFKIDLHTILADDEHGAVLSTTTGERDGKSFSTKTVDVFHFAGGKVSEVWTVDQDQYTLDEIFA